MLSLPAERNFEDVNAFAVADAFELAIKLGEGIVRVTVFVLVFSFELALFDGMVEVRLGDGLKGEQGESEGGCGGVETSVVRIDGLFSAVLEALEKIYGGEEREKGKKGPEKEQVEVHGRPL